MSDCIFCKIVAKKIPAEILYEDDDMIVFKDIAPHAPVHLLVVPKIHITSMLQINSDNAALIGRLASVAHEMAKKEGISDSGYRLVTNTGPDSGQEIDHIHFHILGGRKLGLMG